MEISSTVNVGCHLAKSSPVSWIGGNGPLSALLAHPSARFLVELTLDVHGSRVHLGQLIAALGGAELPALRRLVLVERASREIPHYSLEPLPRTAVGRVLARLPRLRGLVLDGDGFVFGDVSLAELESIEIITDGNLLAHLVPLARAHVPKLATLIVRLRADVDQQLSCHLGSILHEDLGARLVHFGLTGARCAWTAYDVIRLLATMPRASLRVLDLSDNWITELELFRLERTAFVPLELLDVSGHALSVEGLERVRRLADVVLDDNAYFDARERERERRLREERRALEDLVQSQRDDDRE